MDSEFEQLQEKIVAANDEIKQVKSTVNALRDELEKARIREDERIQKAARLILSTLASPSNTENDERARRRIAFVAAVYKTRPPKLDQRRFDDAVATRLPSQNFLKMPGSMVMCSPQVTPPKRGHGIRCPFSS